MKTELWNLTWPEAREAAKKETVVIIPTGSTEQHGPHLPMKVDIAIADYIARKVAKKNNMLVTPPLNFGYAEIWQHYPGTISFTQETYRAALRDICASLIRGGFKKLFIINGHNPNLIHVQAVVYEITDLFGEEGIQIGGASYFMMAKDECDQIGENFRDGTHANEMETSLSLAIYPELVNKDEIARVSASYKFAKAINFEGGAMILNRWPDSEIYHGVYGNPGLATVEKGNAYLNVIIEKIAEFLVKFDKGEFNPDRGDGSPRTS